MTENKRFTCKIDESDGHLVDVWYDNGKPIYTASKVCDLLNEQHETIQRLKQNIDELLSVNVEEELLKENEQLRHDATILIQSNQDYRKENERLRKCMNEIYTIARLEEVD